MKKINFLSLAVLFSLTLSAGLTAVPEIFLNRQQVKVIGAGTERLLLAIGRFSDNPKTETEIVWLTDLTRALADYFALTKADSGFKDYAATLSPWMIRNTDFAGTKVGTLREILKSFTAAEILKSDEKKQAIKELGAEISSIASYETMGPKIPDSIKLKKYENMFFVRRFYSGILVQALLDLNKLLVANRSPSRQESFVVPGLIEIVAVTTATLNSFETYSPGQTLRDPNYLNIALYLIHHPAVPNLMEELTGFVSKAGTDFPNYLDAHRTELVGIVKSLSEKANEAVENCLKATGS